MSAPNQASQAKTLSLIKQAIATIERSPEGGEWLEHLTVATAPLIREWDIAAAWAFKEWPDREKHGYGQKDFGIDVVAQRHDRSLVAIQCKSRAQSGSITYSEMAHFITASTPEHWAERWLIVNRDASPNKEARRELDRIKSRPLKSDSLHECLVTERDALLEALRPKQQCPHCKDPDSIQTKDCMQAEVVDACVSKLRENQAQDGDGTPKGEARGRLILPCGTGKTRISLRIVERLATNMGDVSAVLCPSIALVAQIRAEYIRNHEGRINTLSVCSDQAAGDPVGNEERHARNPDPTDDSGLLPVSALKGLVTTDPQVIGGWLNAARAHNGLNVIFSTYQSAHCIATALRDTHMRLQVLVCDEAHRTAGIKRPRAGRDESALRNFTICHDSKRFPASFRLYQTATPRIYDHDSKHRASEQDLYVADMDDQATFGVLLKRMTFADAVRNQWLSDYRIIAIADTGEDTLAQANQLASALKAFKGRKPKLGVPDLQKGLAFALAMGQAVRVTRDEPEMAMQSCIAFLNTVANSKAMRNALADPSTVGWLNKRLDSENAPRRFVEYGLEHLDASSPLTERKAAKANLANGTPERPHAVFNVGIFGEGTDSPSLSAVAFLEPRKSAIDVVQAVGRAMRKAPGKARGYIIVPIQVPSDRPAEEWLMTSNPEDGWQELGQVLQALRAHDKRIEDELPQKLTLAVPSTDGRATTLLGVKPPGQGKVVKFVHQGLARDANKIAAEVANGTVAPDHVEAVPIKGVADLDKRNLAPTRLITAQVRPGASKPEMRINNVDPRINDRKQPSDTRNKVMRNAIGDTINRKPGKDGRRLPDAEEQAKAGQSQELFFDNPQFKAFADGIQMNLLSKSGIGETKVERDANILIDKVRKAADYLRRDGLKADLDRHFQLDRLAANAKSQGDSTNVAGLMLLNAAMLHQRIADGAWLDGVRPLTDICAAADPVSEFQNEWARIRGWDFEAIIGPASEIVLALHGTGKTAGLAQALRSVAESASEIAAIYADMGTDHAGKVYNQFMADQASDGAYFTRPAAATLLAQLALDVCGDNVKWGKANRIVDLACGSGTLLAAAMADIKKRHDVKTDDAKAAALQRTLVQDCLVGLDVNPISLQLAAAQLTGSTHNIRYRRMNLCHMPYGPQPNGQVRGGSIELFAAEQITPPANDMDFREPLGGDDVWTLGRKVEDAAELVDGAKLVLMNPPYSNRSKMGEKFTKEGKALLRDRIDALYGLLGDGAMAGFDVRNSLHPMFVALADACLSDDGVMAFVCPTIALTSPSGLDERLSLARNYHVHTILVSNHANNRNMSQATGIDEALVILVKQTQSQASNRPTRVVVIDRFPANEEESAELHAEIVKLEKGGRLPNGTGEVSWWPAERITTGNWAPTTLHSPELREAAVAYADGFSGKLQPLAPEYSSRVSGGGRTPSQTGANTFTTDTKGFWTSLEGRFVPKTTKQELNRHHSRDMT